MFRPVYLVIVSCVLVIVVGQFFFKMAALGLRLDSALPISTNLHNNIKPVCMIFFALFFYLLSTLGWVFALRTVPLSVAFMFNAISFALVPAVGFLVFGESVPRFFWMGFAFIVLGLAMILLPGFE